MSAVRIDRAGTTITVPLGRALADMHRAPLHRDRGGWRGSAQAVHSLHTVAALQRRGWAAVFDGPGVATITTAGEAVLARYAPAQRRRAA